jgi:hypothetical protein
MPSPFFPQGVERSDYEDGEDNWLCSKRCVSLISALIQNLAPD